MALTNKELMLIQDNIKMTQNTIGFLRGCASVSNDQQVKSLCQKIAGEQQNDLQVLMKHITTATVQ